MLLSILVLMHDRMQACMIYSQEKLFILYFFFRLSDRTFPESHKQQQLRGVRSGHIHRYNGFNHLYTMSTRAKYSINWCHN